MEPNVAASNIRLMRSSEDPDEVVSAVSRTYARNAAAYIRRTRSFVSFPGLDREVSEFVRSVHPGPVLDVGTGSGRDGRAAAEAGCRTVFADISLGMLRASGCVTVGPAVCCDVRRLPFRPHTFRGLIASGVLLHLPRRACGQALMEIARVLTADGRAAISMKTGSGEGWRTSPDFPDPRWFSYYLPDEFEAMCIDNGLIPLSTSAGVRGDWFTVIVTPDSPNQRHSCASGAIQP